MTMDPQEDITFLMERMNASVQDLSSYDEYVTEVRSGRLEWSPVHRWQRWTAGSHTLLVLQE